MGRHSRPRGGASRSVQRSRIDPVKSAANSAIKRERINNKRIEEDRKEQERRLQEQLRVYGGRTAQRVREMQQDGSSAPHEHLDQTDDHNQAFDELDETRMEMEVDEDNEEDDDVLRAIRDYMGLTGKRRKYRDTRTWAARLSRQQQNWDNIIEDLANAYLGWKYPADACPHTTRSGDQAAPDASHGIPETRETSPGAHRMRDHMEVEDTAATRAETRPAAQPPATNNAAGTASAPSDPGSAEPPRSASGDHTYDFTLDVIDMVTLAKQKHFRRDATQRTPIAIAEQGFLPTSPANPTLAISFTTLEYFRRLRARKASYSVEAFAKVLCDLYGIPYRRRFRTAVSDTYDIYLAIHRIVDKRVKAYLGEHGPNWRVKNACPACCFKVDGEEELPWGRMFSIDGNNSLKRVAKIGDRDVADRREFTESDYYLLTDYVDRFKDEVKRQRNQDLGEPVDDDEDDAWSDVEEGDEGSAADFAGADDMLRQCTQNWKAAASDEKKKMWGIFDETGVFAAACRHGFMLWVVDMVKSGELAKYALAVIAKALEVLDDRLLIGYDIGCTFDGTVKASSLGPAFVRSGSRCCVNAFHGYSHSHQCQTVNHPSVITGAGLEDFETMERAFSASNELAPIIRYASKYHRRMHIDRHYAQADEDKYANLGTMLRNNYRQALEILDNDVPLLEEWLAQNNCREEDLERWHKEEVAYFATVGQVTEVDPVALEYVARLQEYWDLEDRASKAQDVFVTSIPEDYEPSAPRTRQRNADYSRDAAATLKRETNMRLLRERRDSALRDVISLELQMGLPHRWNPSTPQFVQTAQYLVEREYRLALDQLHRLVVQRLFELHTMNLSRTAYKVRVQIAKSLQRRSKAIRTAINQYNTAAQKLKNPKPALDWDKVSHYVFIEEFELLRDTRNDLSEKPWAQAATREHIKRSRKIRRAREEIRRCNIEIRRVHSAIVLENTKLDAAIKSSREERNPIAGAIADYSFRRQGVNARLLATFEQIYAMPGFSGIRTPGRRKGTNSDVSVSPSSSIENAVAAETEELRADSSQQHGLDDGELEEATAMMQFALSLT